MEEQLPEHIENIIQNTDEVDRLIEIHAQLGGTGAGRRHNIEVINRSAIVMLVACWEAYIEDLATIGFDYLLLNAESAEQLPEKLKANVARRIKEKNDDRFVWKLADTGWKQVLNKYKIEILTQHTGRFNTPRVKQVDKLYESLIGLRHVSNSWKWSGTSNTNAKRRLENLVTLRGEIAHKVMAGRSVHKEHVVSARHLIGFLSAATSNRIADHLTEITGRTPFDHVEYSRKA